MIDPKRVELTLYKPLPHLLSPVITDPKKAVMALRWAGKEMARRYDILEEHRVRDIESYHQNVLAPKLEALRKDPDVSEEASDPMPYIVIVIDELADIMQTFPRELEAAIVRLAQMSRAVGIHLILSTQRPSVNVITGLIKANVPARIALQVASQIDSRTIIDMAGAEKLLGAGDMLYLSADKPQPVRLQSAFISEEEVKRVADYIGKNNDAELPVEFGGGQAIGGVSEGGPAFSGGMNDDFGDEGGSGDDMYPAAEAAVREAGRASTSYLQRKLGVGYSRAAKLMDMLEGQGVIGPANGSKPREVIGAKAPTGGEVDM
jgi:S-DNA-T family DNA segregation ATPase FtsK/SpoIIIE